MDETPTSSETEQIPEWELPLTADTEFGGSSAHGPLEITPPQY